MGVLSSGRLVAAYSRANLQRALEYRSSFASEAVSMLISDVTWLVFWTAFYDRFPAVPGWGRAQVVTLWSVVAAGYGLANAVFGNATRLAGLVRRGELDFFLTLPRPVLLHALISRMSAAACGDVIFGGLAFALFVRPGPLDAALFGLLAVSNAGIVVGFAVMVGSLAFWLGSAEGLAQQAINVLVGFSTHPTSLFRGWVKTLLFTALPAGFLAFVPVEILRAHRSSWLAGHVAFSAALIGLGALVFTRGLRRYESGNLFTTRG